MKKIVSLLTAVLVTAFGTAPAYAESAAVETLTEKQLIVGDQNGDLRLEDKLTRAEFTKLLCEALSLDKSGEISFDDVPEGFWGFDYIGRAVYAGIISGYPDNTFRCDADVLYEEAAKMTVAACTHPGGSYPYDYVAAAVELGLMDNVSSLMGEPLTRRDAAEIIYNMLRYIEDNGQTDSYSGKVITGGSTAIPAPGSGYPVEVKEDEADSGAAEPGYVMPRPPYGPFNTEEYATVSENGFKSAKLSPLSTLSVDIDTASYSNMRRFIMNGMYPQAGSVRSEELINYFSYDFPTADDGKPFSVVTEASACPWNNEHLLAMVALHGNDVNAAETEGSNLVFLIDVSGSMYSYNKLPLVKKGMNMLIDNLSGRDTVSIVTYASGTRVVLESTPVSQKDKIKEALNSLTAGGGTSGYGGLNLAYAEAQKSMKANNRIIICSDGDFNIGPSSAADLESLVSEKRGLGIYLSVLGFGMGNYKDTKMETLADKGNGSYAYIDSLREAQKVFSDELTRTLYTIAEDAKIQVEFNPDTVDSYRLIGYENRVMANESFADDTKDAGEINAASDVVAFFEIVPKGGESGSDELRYQTVTGNGSDELMFVKIRYKNPGENESILFEKPVPYEIGQSTSDNFRFAAACAELGMLLNESEYLGTSNYDSVISLARSAKGEDETGVRGEFIQLVDLLRYIYKLDVRG